MSQVRLDPGIYINVFPVTLLDKAVAVMRAARRVLPDLHPVRERIMAEGWSARVYASGGNVYGYGSDACRLRDIGFGAADILLSADPGFATRLVLEGLADVLKAEGYEIGLSRGRPRLSSLRPIPFGKAASEEVLVYLGYDLRALYWGDRVRPEFGLVVDVTWAVRDAMGNRLSTDAVAQRGATIEVAQIQGEYLQGGSRINTEIARTRLLEQILPFVQSHCVFTLPCGGCALLETEPARVVLGGHER